ncbi:hypothetical protein N656DRAFT_180485 [Canariomyces notabilis]|uniref:Protein kinase C n=1 Tax=Canariomyces notabilis TaxID=2074819 RepID=A0AAN6QNU7_9PEZI|nr:hypothetical protein N656DRAFT_180485 [Canariomyces arenarius]
MPIHRTVCADGNANLGRPADSTIADDSINMPNLRKPLTGQLSIRILAVKDVDHAPLSRFSRAPETFVAIKVEDQVMARTRATRNDRWEAEFHNIFVEKANEIELTVYDKPGEHALPIGLLWVRISDIAEELRRKRIEAETNTTGWVSADRLGANPRIPPPQFPMGPQSPQFAGPPTSPVPPQQGQMYNPPPAHPPIVSQPIDAWFNLEPTGQIQLSLNFVKENKEPRPMDAGLNRKGAVRQRKEEVHEMYGHKFVSRQFYNIMRCALCGDFLKYSAGMQCDDCKYTCHTKCYTSVVTKCISKSNSETDPDEEKINHRIPHRFQPFSNLTANWCCHCGYMLTIGSKKNCRKCVGMYLLGSPYPHPVIDADMPNRMRSHCSRTMRSSCSRFLRHVHGRRKSDPGRNPIHQTNSPRKGFVYERAHAASGQQRNNK